MMDDWRIRRNSRFHVPPGIFFERADDDEDREPYCEGAPTFQCSLSPALAKLLFAMIHLSILFTTTVPSFQTRELGHVRLWRWQLVAFFAFYGRFISRAITTGVLHVIENSNDARLKGNLPHAYAVKRTFEYLLSFAILLTTWILLIDTPLKKLGNITKILSCAVVTMIIWCSKVIVWKAMSISFHRRNYLEQIKEAIFALYILRSMLTPLKDPNQMTEEREVIVAAALKNRRGHKLLQGQMTFCQWRLVSADSSNDWVVWNMINLVRNANALDETLRLLPHRRSTHPNLNTWDDKAISVSEEIIKKVSKSESREISLEDLSYCMPKAIVEEALKRIGATQGKFGIDELVIWMSRNFEKHKGLELSLDDTHRALRSLHGTVDGVVLKILSFAWLAILNTVNVLPRDEEMGQTIYIVILFLALAVAFVYHFLWDIDGYGVRFFFRHALQVGETCTMDGKKMQVEKLGVWSTQFLTMAGHEPCCRNSMLLGKEIIKDPPFLLTQA
ncbi:mechanosensitive ion channel protein 6-like [Rhododendron vialii]|uniref:mechanosensitive ion channel protein 6-like n=1 Tax=Rhododendron vialii TaxID=182163 RepID=UPI00265EC643|nr:mechanosensitive ion channel protein 6-like [Rhododendron vialii]